MVTIYNIGEYRFRNPYFVLAFSRKVIRWRWCVTMSLEENAEMTLVEQFLVSLSADESFKGCTNVVTEMDNVQSSYAKQILVQQR